MDEVKFYYLGMRAYDISVTDMLILCVINEECDRKGFCKLVKSDVADYLGASRNTITNSVKTLKEKNLINELSIRNSRIKAYKILVDLEEMSKAERKKIEESMQYEIIE